MAVSETVTLGTVGDQSTSVTHQIHHWAAKRGDNPVAKCRVSKTWEGKVLSVHSYRASSSKMSCRTVQVLPELRLSTIPAVHCIVAARGFSKKSRISFHSPTEWATWMPPTPKKDIRSRRSFGVSHRTVLPVQRYDCETRNAQFV